MQMRMQWPRVPSTKTRVESVLQLTGPHLVVARPRLVVLAGLPASGKSTLARALGASTGISVLESDAVRKHLLPNPRLDNREHRAVFNVIERCALHLLQLHSSVLVDAMSLRDTERGVHYRLAARAGVNLTLVWVEVPEPVSPRPAARRPGRWATLGRHRRGLPVDEGRHAAATCAVYPRRWHSPHRARCRTITKDPR